MIALWLALMAGADDVPDCAVDPLACEAAWATCEERWAECAETSALRVELEAAMAREIEELQAAARRAEAKAHRNRLGYGIAGVAVGAIAVGIAARLGGGR